MAEVVEQQLIEVKDVLVRAVEVKAQRFPANLGETQVVEALQTDHHHLLGAPDHPLWILEFGTHHFHRPQRDRITIHELAREPVHRL